MTIVVCASPLLEQECWLRSGVEKDWDSDGADTHHASWTADKDLVMIGKIWEHHCVPDRKDPAIRAVVLTPARASCLDSMTKDRGGLKHERGAVVTYKQQRADFRAR